MGIHLPFSYLYHIHPVLVKKILVDFLFGLVIAVFRCARGDENHRANKKSPCADRSECIPLIPIFL